MVSKVSLTYFKKQNKKKKIGLKTFQQPVVNIYIFFRLFFFGANEEIFVMT